MLIRFDNFFFFRVIAIAACLLAVPYSHSVAAWLLSSALIFSTLSLCYISLTGRQDLLNALRTFDGMTSISRLLMSYVSFVGVALTLLLFLPAILNADFTGFGELPRFIRLNFVLGLFIYPFVLIEKHFLVDAEDTRYI